MLFYAKIHLIDENYKFLLFSSITPSCAYGLHGVINVSRLSACQIHITLKSR